MQKKIKDAIEKLKSLSEKKPIKVISHFDTDGITSAAIFSRSLQRWGKNFSLQITKGLDEHFIEALPDSHVLVFLDLGSGSLNHLKQKDTEIIILDHHELPENQEIPENIFMVNPTLEGHDQISSAGLCYIFAKLLSPKNTDLSTLAVLGMVGDVHDQNKSNTYDEIIKDSDTIIKRGPLIYPSTRPLNKALEYSSSPYIPNVTGSYKGTIKLLREAKIPQTNGTYKALYELSDSEMTNLINAIMLRSSGSNKDSDILGNLYLVKFHNKLEDARELSALINACSRMDSPEISLGFCLGNKSSKEKAEKIYRGYKQHLVSALKFVAEAEKISGDKYTIINAKDNIKDTIIGTTASIISRSPLYDEGTIIIALAYNKDKIKVSARIAGKKGRNVREVLSKAIVPLGGEVGGHPNAAGCLIEKSQETEFISELKKVLDIELVKL
jgi:single-stranded-DNA-specific exonuclease